MNKNKLRWGILGTGSIARTFAGALLQSRTGELAAIGSRTEDTARAFAQNFPPARAHSTYERLLADPEVEAVYISTPHPMHKEWVIEAAKAGKHILCEKPLAMGHDDASAMVDAARKHDVFLMEAFMYRCHPQTKRLVQLIREGAIGKVGLIQATFSFATTYSPFNRFFSKELGGGGILDVGCYCISMARLIAGAAVGKNFANPIQMKGTGVLHPETGVDEWATATLSFPNRILAQVSCGISLKQESVVRIFGTRGSIFIPLPWFPGLEKGESRFFVYPNDQEPVEVTTEATEGLYAIEADTVAMFIDQRQSPSMSWDDSLGNMQALDQWRSEIA